jgi:hypothetical protein
VPLKDKGLMTWEGAKGRWRKMLKGRVNTITCESLGVPGTKQGSYRAANSWWEAKVAEIAHSTPIFAKGNRLTLLASSIRTRVSESKGLPAHPWDRSGLGVERRLSQDRIVRSFLEVDVDLIFGDPNGARGLDDLPTEPFWLRLGESMKLARQPAVASVGHDRQSRIQIGVQRDFAGQAIEMEEADAAPQGILNPVAARVPRHDLSSGLLAVVGQQERGLVASQAGDGDLSQFSLVVGDANELLEISDVPVSAFRRIDHGASPCGIRLIAKTAKDSASPASDRDERRLASGVEPVHLGVRREPRIEVDPRGVGAQDRAAELDELEQLSRCLVANDGRVRVAQQPGFHGLGEERENAGNGLATHRDMVVLQPVVLAAMGDRVEIQAERVGLGIEPGQQLGDPSGEQALLILPDRAVRIVGGESRFGQDVEAGEDPQRLVKIEVADVASPFLVDQLQGQQAQQRRGRRDHAGAGVTGLLDQLAEAQLRQQRPEGEEAGNAGLERRRLLLERACSDVGDSGSCRLDQVVGRDVGRPAELGDLKKGGGESERIAARNSWTNCRRLPCVNPYFVATSFWGRPSTKTARNASYWRW